MKCKKNIAKIRFFAEFFKLIIDINYSSTTAFLNLFFGIKLLSLRFKSFNHEKNFQTIFNTNCFIFNIHILRKRMYLQKH